jgi:hypothetical protein
MTCAPNNTTLYDLAPNNTLYDLCPIIPYMTYTPNNNLYDMCLSIRPTTSRPLPRNYVNQ